MVVPQTDGRTIGLGRGPFRVGTCLIVRNGKLCRNGLIALLALAPALAGCSGGNSLDQMSSELKDAQWFQRTGRLFIRNIAMCFDNTLSPAGERRHSKTI